MRCIVICSIRFPAVSGCQGAARRSGPARVPSETRKALLYHRAPRPVKPFSGNFPDGSGGRRPRGPRPSQARALGPPVRLATGGLPTLPAPAPEGKEKTAKISNNFPFRPYASHMVITAVGKAQISAFSRAVTAFRFVRKPGNGVYRSPGTSGRKRFRGDSAYDASSDRLPPDRTSTIIVFTPCLYLIRTSLYLL